MSKSVFGVLVCALLFTQIFATLHEIRIYEEPDQKGESITFTVKYPNLADWKFFLNKAQSYCLTGFWVFCDLPNFLHNSTGFAAVRRTEVCGNTDFSAFNSARFVGPEDFDTPAISLHEGSKGNGIRNWNGGREYVLTGPAGNDIQFRPILANSFGNSSWTLFTGKNFDGNSTCFAPGNSTSSVPTGMMHFDSSFIVQSVIKGCDSVQVGNNMNIDH